MQLGGFSLSFVPILHKQDVPDSHLMAVLQVRQSVCDGPLHVKQVLWQIKVQTYYELL